MTLKVLFNSNTIDSTMSQDEHGSSWNTKHVLQELYLWKTGNHSQTV